MYLVYNIINDSIKEQILDEVYEEISSKDKPPSSDIIKYNYNQ